MVNLLVAVALNVAFWSGVHVLVARRTRFGSIGQVLATTVVAFVAILISLELLSFAGLINSTSVAVVSLGTGLTAL